MLNKFDNAQQAFEFFFDYISERGQEVNNTKELHNIGFYIENPLDNHITTTWRKWSKDYAQYEWEWYLSENRNIQEISKRAKIWASIADENNNVNSNYGFQWNRNNQLDKVIEMLKADKTTRRASVSLYDGKEIDDYAKDTICTYSINFYFQDDKLNMSVLMRSNDLVYGFCNDQYCFSKLQELVANRLNAQVGTYYHFAQNFHIYNRHFYMNK
jgi:thymidylate synthase